MKTGLLLLSVCILTTVCAFAQNEQKRPFERENHRERAPQSTFFSLRENENPEIRRGRTPIATLQSATATHRLDSTVRRGTFDGVERKEKEVFEYDDNGNVIMWVFYWWEKDEWRESWKTEYTFDDNGNLVLQIRSAYMFDWEWCCESNTWIETMILSKWKNESTFDDNGNRTMQISYRWEYNAWVKRGKNEFTFDNNGNMIMRISYHWHWINEWVESWKDEFTFDDNGNMIMRISYSWENNEWVESWKSEYTFDNNGNMIMRVSYSWEDNAWVENWKNKFEFTFDDNGNIVMRIGYWWENNTWVEDWKSEYTFDNNGNIVMGIWYRWEKDEWREDEKAVAEYDFSVFIRNIILPVFEFSFAKMFYNKPVRGRSYIWIENAWQEIEVLTFYYTKLSTINIPTIPATSISVFPNPASYHFTVSGITKNTLVTISNLTGQIVLQQVVSPSENISVNHLPAGIYIVNVIGESQRLIVR